MQDFPSKEEEKQHNYTLKEGEDPFINEEIQCSYHDSDPYKKQSLPVKSHHMENSNKSHHSSIESISD